mmetsp:Transcript_23062/g.58471  ORF Transcript_23062/g.58471 Transcript_23062/m.58471 type:complete len:245 (-) Transcript_23062:206-940(-)
MKSPLEMQRRRSFWFVRNWLLELFHLIMKMLIPPDLLELSEGQRQLPSQVGFLKALKGQKPLLVLDLDETLIHSTQTPTDESDFHFETNVEGRPATFYVAVRPHAYYFLSMVSHWYEVVVFTSSVKEYGEMVIDHLRRHADIKGGLFRDSCTTTERGRVKDLRAQNCDMNRTIVIDNSPEHYRCNPENAIPISSWTHKQDDEELLSLLPMLNALRHLRDVRSVLKLRLKTIAASVRLSQRARSV